MSSETQNPQPVASDLPDGASADELAMGMILNDGEPFRTRRSATTRMKELALPEGTWEVDTYGDGFAVLKKARPDDAAVAAPKTEPYKWVRFHNKSNPMDPDEVTLGVNGEIIIIMRNQRIPLPQRFLEVADHAVYRHFSQSPGKDRKIDREIHKYPYDVLGEATRDDFVRWKRAGTKATRDHAEKIGLPVEA